MHLEFTPYWTTNHELSLKDYLYPRDFEQVIRNSSISIASTQKFLLEDSTSTNSLAFGYRTTLQFGNNKDRETIKKFENEIKGQQKVSSRINAEAEGLVANNKIKDKNDFLKKIRNKVEEAVHKFSLDKGLKDDDAKTIIKTIFEKAETLPRYEEDHDKFLDEFYNLIDETTGGKEIFDKFKNYIKERQGLRIDIAFVTLINFPTNNFEFSISPRQALWITPSYRFEDELGFLKVMGVLRYEWYNTDYYKKYFPKSKFYQNNTDYGLAIVTDLAKFSVQFELVGRTSKSEISLGVNSDGLPVFAKDENSDFQYIGTFSYNLSDQITLNYSLGNRFKPELDPTNTLLSLISLNFGFGTPTDEDMILDLSE